MVKAVLPDIWFRLCAPDTEPRDKEFTATEAAKYVNPARFREALLWSIERLVRSESHGDLRQDWSARDAMTVLNYGRPSMGDIATETAIDQARLIARLNEMVRRFEPRLKDATFLIDDEATSAAGHIRLTLVARLPDDDEQNALAVAIDVSQLPFGISIDEHEQALED